MRTGHQYMMSRLNSTLVQENNIFAENPVSNDSKRLLIFLHFILINLLKIKSLNNFIIEVDQYH